jgi:hypothetical protein
VLPAFRADNSAVLVVLNVKVTMEAQLSIPPQSIHDLLQESFTFTFKKHNDLLSFVLFGSVF